MSCFWDTLIKNIKKDDLTNILNITTTKPLDFCNGMKGMNCKTENVLWNGSRITEKQYEENIEWINEYHPSTISNGYDCSIFDPFLFLITEIFQIEIQHHYNGTFIQYQYKNPRYSIKIQSNKGHMW